MNPFRTLTVFFALLLPALSQTHTGELRVSVRDQTGASVRAMLHLTADSTHVAQSVNITKPEFSFKNLPFGTYRLTTSAAGFAQLSRIIHIDSEVPIKLDLTITPQTVETAVQVDGSQTLMDTQRTGSANYIGEQQIKERRAGLAGRGLVDLIAMQPGWTFEANGVLHPRESEYDTQFVVNGFPLQDNRSPAFARPVQADDVQEVKTYTSSIPAEFGHKLGGVIEINTTRNTAQGFHGETTLQGGSFSARDGYLSLQYVARATTYTVSGEGFATDHYLDPPTVGNFHNHGASGMGGASVEHDFSDTDRLRISLSGQHTGFQVPNDLLQQSAGQSQDRGSQEVSGEASYQHIFSPSLLGVVRARVRDVSAGLDSNPLSSPIIASQDRGLREDYTNASLSGHHGHYEWKVGAEASYGSIRENFAYHITEYQLRGEQIFDPSLPATYNFTGHSPDREQSAFAQDTISLGRLTINTGLRYDHYSLLMDEQAISPRLGISWFIQSTGTLFHASYDRVFGTPPFENLLVSAAPSTRFSGIFLPLHPSRGNYYELGFSQDIAGHARLDVSIFDRRVRNFEDDDLLLNTGVSFPISFDNADVHGLELKLDAPHMGRFSGSLSYANSVGTGRFPISGGLFLDTNAAALLRSNARFVISQDQRNTGSGWLRYQWTKRLWTTATASYNSGLPIEDAGELPDTGFLAAQLGSAVLSKVNLDRGRVRPSATFDASIGFDLLHTDKRSATLQFDALNLANRLNVINFAGLLSGTAVAPPRSYGVKLNLSF
jgi:hypothetical protein